MKKLLITGGNSMLAYDFIRTQKEKYEIIALSKKECDVTSFESVIQCISFYEPDIVLNCAAYTNIDEAEDIGMKECYDVNTLGAYNLARATSAFDVVFLTISTDYVFDGKRLEGYTSSDKCNPLGVYGMSKYLGEELARKENPRTIIIRTSWLYGGELFLRVDPHNQFPSFKNFVNKMLRFSEDQKKLKIINDQYGIPTSCIELSQALHTLLENSDEYEGLILHLSASCKEGCITWADFAREIFRIMEIDITIEDCLSGEYPRKAKRPEWGVLKNNSDIVLRDWTYGLYAYLKGK